MRICITRSNKNAYSETFIIHQIKGLSKLASVFSIHTGWLPEYSEDNRLLNSKLFWMMHKIFKNLFKADNNYFGNFGLKKYMVKNEIDVVLANYGVSGVKLLPICKSLNIPMLVHFYGFDAFHYATLAKYKNLYQELFDYTLAIIVVSHDMQQQLISLGAPSNKVYLNPCGADIKRFIPTNPALNKNIFLAIGRFTAKKAPQLTIEAFKKVHEVVPDAKLIMIGEGEPLFHFCKELIHNLQLEQAVNLEGGKTHSETIRFLKNARAFVQHSITAEDGDKEGTPVAILEAASSGLPIVSTFHGGIKDAVINGETGFLVEEGDVEEMAKCMIKLARNPKMAAEMGQAGREHIEKNYDLDNQINKLYNIIYAAVK